MNCHCLSANYNELKSLYDAQTDSLIRAWEECDRLKQALQEETLKNQPLTNLLHGDRGLDALEYGPNEESRGRDLTEKNMQNTATIASFEIQLEQERAAKEKLRGLSEEPEPSVQALDKPLVSGRRLKKRKLW